MLIYMVMVLPAGFSAHDVQQLGCRTDRLKYSTRVLSASNIRRQLFGIGLFDCFRTNQKKQNKHKPTCAAMDLTSLPMRVSVMSTMGTLGALPPMIFSQLVYSRSPAAGDNVMCDLQPRSAQLIFCSGREWGSCQGPVILAEGTYGTSYSTGSSQHPCTSRCMR